MMRLQETMTFLVLFVDNILLISNDKAMLKDVMAWLSKTFSIKGKGKASYNLWIKLM